MCDEIVDTNYFLHSRTAQEFWLFCRGVCTVVEPESKTSNICIYSRLQVENEAVLVDVSGTKPYSLRHLQI